MNKNIKAIIFDLGQVLIDLTPARCMEAFAQLGANDIEQALNDKDIQQFLLQFENGDVSEQEFYDKMNSLLPQPADNALIAAAWNSFLGELPAYKLDAILELRKQYKVYLLSNTNVLHWEYARHKYFDRYKGLELRDFFDHAYTSYQMRLLKPDKAIYQSVLDDIGLKPQEVFFLDDRADNCRSAREMGINVYEVTPGEDWRHLFD